MRVISKKLIISIIIFVIISQSFLITVKSYASEFILQNSEEEIVQDNNEENLIEQENLEGNPQIAVDENKLSELEKIDDNNSFEPIVEDTERDNPEQNKEINIDEQLEENNEILDSDIEVNDDDNSTSNILNSESEIIVSSSGNQTKLPSDSNLNYADYFEVLTDTENEWYVSHNYKEIVFSKYNYRTNKFSKVYTYNISDKDKNNTVYINCYNNGDIIYVLLSNKANNYKPTIIGYNVKSNNIVFNQTYENVIQKVIFERFLVDSEQRAYFQEDKTIKIYDKTGKQISTFTNQNSNNFSLYNISPDNKIIVLSVNYSYDGFLKVENGVIKSKEVTKYHYAGGYRYVNWKFFSNNVALDTYGEIAVFDSSKSEISYTLKSQINKSTNTRDIPGFKLNNSIYYGGSKGMIYKQNIKTFSIEGTYVIPNTNSEICSMNYSNGTIYVVYKVEDSSTYGYTYYLTSFTDSQIKKPVTYTFNKNTATGHTKAQITQKYNEAKAKFDYRNQSVYQNQPSTKNPYKAGSLKDQVKKDTLNQINFYRWLYGINTISLNTSKMDRNQKGAVLLAALKTLSHYPSKPKDMDNSFYNEAYAGCNAGANEYSGNVAYGYSMPNSIYGYIDDSFNISANVGHRTSLLDLSANTVSFGYCNSYNTLSIYYSNNTKNKDNFYSYPTPGYFPNECISTNAMWSINLNDKNYNFNDFNLTISSKGITANNVETYYDRYTKTLYFSVPNNIKKAISDGSYSYLPETVVNIKATGIKDNEGNSYVINYNTHFYSINQSNATANVKYRTHVQNIGWQNYVSNGAMSGTQGKSLRLEGINIYIDNSNISGGIEYSTHVQNIGWQNFVSNNQMSGTSGKSLRLEAIKIRLTGELKNAFDIYYRVHCENFGWLGWAKNGQESGSAGYGYRLEGIEIKLVKKGGSAPGSTSNYFHQAPPNVNYRTHVQNIGWQNYVSNGAMSGTQGKSLRLEGINININNTNISGGIEYATHVQNIGWQNFVKNGQMSGTSGKGLRLEAIKIKLTGDLANKYDIYYRVHCENFGWLGWAKNGAESGSAGYGYRLEGIEIRLVNKGSSAPGSTARAFIQK